MTDNTPDKPKLKTGYLKVQLDYAPKTNGKKFAEWCKKYGFAPIGSGRRAWCSSLGTYLRGASGVAFADGEMFLFYEEDLIDIADREKKMLEFVIGEDEEELDNKFDRSIARNRFREKARQRAKEWREK